MTDGAVQTRLMPQGQDVHVGESPLLFYAVGRDKLLSVPADAAASFVEECRLMEMVVEEYQGALAELSAANSSYITLMASARRDHRFLLDKEVLQGEIVAAQRKVEHKNQALKNVIEPLTELSSETNKVMELIPIRRGGSRTEHFRLAYARSHIIRAFAEEIPLASDGTNSSESVLTGGRVDWEKLSAQLEELATTGKIQIDFPWFDDWLKKDEETIDLFRWSKALNDNLQYRRTIVSGTEHDRDSYRVELSAEAQLMRWTSGASGLSGEVNPFERTAFLKADAKAELVLAEAKATLDYYTPVGGLMLACELPGQQVVDLGMVRCRTLITGGGGAGASISAELNLNIEMRQGQLRADGVQGELVGFGLPGEQRVVLSEHESAADNNEAKLGMEAFAGGEMEASVGVQLEWKSPEEGDTFQPFAKTAVGRAVLAGVDVTVGFAVRFAEGKFRISAKAGCCLGFGNKGKIDFEVDSDLLMEFVKWVAYQLKNIDYGKLFFISEDAFFSISNIIAASTVCGNELRSYLKETADEIHEVTVSIFNELSDSIGAAYQRGSLAEKINEDPWILRYSTPDTKGMIIFQLMKTNALDRLYPGNRDLEGWWENPSFFGFMNDRKEAIMNILRLIQSKSEFKSVMKRVTPEVGKFVEWEKGREAVSEFLARGEKDLPPPLSSHFENDLVYLQARLREKASIGVEIYRNDSREYFMQGNVARDFRTPCGNDSICVIEDVSETTYEAR